VIRPCIHGYMPGKCSKYKDCPNHKPRRKPLSAELQAKADEVARAVGHEYGFSVDALKSHERHAPLSEARATLYYVLRELGWSGPRIGQAVGGRDHSPIYKGLDELRIRMALEPARGDRVRRLVARCKGEVPDLEVNP
jgi:chromosomal replication initiation ATPase DnaA